MFDLRGKERARLRAELVELAPSDEVLVEGSWFPRADLPRILGNYMRAAAEAQSDAKLAATREGALIARVEPLIDELWTVATTEATLDMVGKFRVAVHPEPCLACGQPPDALPCETSPDGLGGHAVAGGCQPA